MYTINSLPDEILCHVLNFLPIKKAALTCLLSKRWRNLFAFRPDLDLCFIDSPVVKTPKCNKSFVCFVDRLLALSENGNFTIRKFSMKLKGSSNSSHINRWMINVLNRGIIELVLDALIEDITLPLDILLYSKTLVKLKLESYMTHIVTVPENASLPALKTLSLKFIKFSGSAFESLVSACPVLEELTFVIDHWYSKHPKQSYIVSSPTLKRLVFKCKYSVSWIRSITFDTPSLAYLEYCSYDVNEYPTVNLNSLVEINLDMAILSTESNPTNLIKGLRNVEILTLSSAETSKFLYYFDEEIPVFENLSQLSIRDRFGSCWRHMSLLLKKTPNLETLVISGPLHSYGEVLICKCLSGLDFLSTCSVKVLEISDCPGTKQDLRQMKQLVKNLPCLELVNVHDCTEAFATNLLTLPIPSYIHLNVFYNVLKNQT